MIIIKRKDTIMTLKYQEVRREVFSNCFGKGPKKYRSFNDIKRVYKGSFWVLPLIMIASIFGFYCLVTFAPDKPYFLIPVLAPFAVSIVFEVSCDKLYNAEERKRELTEIKDSYETYIQNLKTVLSSCGIDSAKKRENLKIECKACLEKQAKPYNSVSSKASNMLIAVPLGAIISAIIYNNSDSSAIAQIVLLIFVGATIIGCCKLFKILSYYSDGYFKDRYLLDALSELEYVDD